MNEEVLLGSLMGDSSIYCNRHKYGNYYSFHIEHSEKQKDYIEWKKIQLNFNTKTYYRERLDKRTNKTYKSYTIYKTSNDFKYYYDLFYKPKKEVSKEILNSLTDLSVAVWYMDDGTLYYNGNIRHLQLAVDGFNKESKDLIIQWFKDKYNINFKLSKFCIRLTSKAEIQKFMNIVKPYLIESMEYKTLNFQENNYKTYKKKS